MELAVGAMASLAPKLGKLLMDEYVVQKGLKPDIQSLSTELVAMHAALIDASRVPPDQRSEMDKFWARQVQELSYDMEDAVDDFAVRVAGRDSTAATDANTFKKILSKATAVVRKAKDRHKISDKINDIKKLSNQLAELRAKYTIRGVGANLAATTGIDPRVLNLYKKESDLVGIEETRDKIIRMLTGAKGHADASEGLKIVSVVGVGGLGKTTLAKTVHDALKNQFQCCAFISVGRTPTLTKIFEKMLAELDEKHSNRADLAGWDLERFWNQLHKLLLNKRYFIIVDDVWDKESWEAIKYALKDNNCGSRIIMTTRNSDVATKAEEVYRLKPLSDENSKLLFYKRIQSQGESIEDLSSEVSSKILDKCGGVPLAIIAIASLLVDKPCEDWSKVNDSIVLGNEDNTMKIMSYSYYDLPSYLKPCLLHLSLFPEDSELDTRSVIWMWIGEGFVHLEKEEGSLFQVGERYFNELVNRCMIQQTGDNSYNDRFAQWFCVHDIVFDLICQVSKDENFVTVLGSREQQVSSASARRGGKTAMPRSNNSKVRRLAIHDHHMLHISEDTMDMPEVLRSLTILDCEIESMAPLHSFRVCRVLDIERSKVPINLNHLGRLLHLKYIHISYTPIDELPKEIGHLKCLLALELINIGLDELPPEAFSLTQLLFLLVVGFKRLPVDKMGKLTSLEELRLRHVIGRSATEDLVVELGKLTRLRVVAISFSEELGESLQKPLVRSLCNLGELHELKLYFEGSQQGATTIWESWVPPRKLRCLLVYGIMLSRLPRWINSSRVPHIYFISLYVHVVEVTDLDNLARLPELSYLELVGNSWPPGYTVGIDGFKNLRSCHVGTTLKFHTSAMPRLEELEFRVYAGLGCSKINGVAAKNLPTKDVIGDLDFGLDNLLSLEQITVSIFCFNATANEVNEVEAAVSRAVKDHANHPTIKVDRLCEAYMCDVENVKASRVIGVLLWKDESDANFIRLLSPYRRLQEAIFKIYCEGASMCEVEKVEAALSHAAEVHPSHPTIELIRFNTEKMLSSSDHPDTELDDHNGSQENSLSRLQLGN